MFLFEWKGLGGEEEQLAARSALRVCSLQFANGKLRVPGFVDEDVVKAAPGKHIVDKGIAADGHIRVAPDEVASWKGVVCSL